MLNTIKNYFSKRSKLPSHSRTHLSLRPSRSLARNLWLRLAVGISNMAPQAAATVRARASDVIHAQRRESEREGLRHARSTICKNRSHAMTKIIFKHPKLARTRPYLVAKGANLCLCQLIAFVQLLNPLIKIFCCCFIFHRSCGGRKSLVNLCRFNFDGSCSTRGRKKFFLRCGTLASRESLRFLSQIPVSKRFKLNSSPFWAIFSLFFVHKATTRFFDEGETWCDRLCLI